MIASPAFEAATSWSRIGMMSGALLLFVAIFSELRRRRKRRA